MQRRPDFVVSAYGFLKVAEESANLVSLVSVIGEPTLLSHHACQFTDGNDVFLILEGVDVALLIADKPLFAQHLRSLLLDVEVREARAALLDVFVDLVCEGHLAHWVLEHRQSLR